MAQPIIVNNPSGGNGNGGRGNAVVWGVVIIVLAVLFLVYGLPMIRDKNGTNVNIPDKIQIRTSPY